MGFIFDSILSDAKRTVSAIRLPNDLFGIYRDTDNTQDPEKRDNETK